MKNTHTYTIFQELSVELRCFPLFNPSCQSFGPREAPCLSQRHDKMMSVESEGLTFVQTIMILYNRRNPSALKRDIIP